MTVRDFSMFFERHHWPIGKGRLPFCIGHRGASGYKTENTLAAFELASKLGAEMWELDTQLTRDNVVVVSHDDHLQRVFGLDQFISQMTAAELRKHVPDVPTFAEVAALGRRMGTGLYIELKAPGSGLRCWRELLLHSQHFACLGSFDTAQVRELADAGCDYPRAVLIRVGHDPFALGDRANANVLHLCWESAGDRPQDLVTAELRERAFSQGRELVLWHEERPSVLAELMAMPVLGICTDLPDLMRSPAPEMVQA